jgi:hypothetical protein
MSNVALLLLFNHNYEANIDKLEKLYASRFDKIFFIMPFYRGKKGNVIPVYENSYYFQGYVAKALEKIKNDGFEHYIIIGDDLLLDPAINQNNYQEYFKLDKETGFMPELFLISDKQQTGPDRPMAPYWPAIVDALEFDINQKGIEVAKFMPTYEEAVERLAKHGLKFTPDISSQFFIKPMVKVPLNKADYEYRKRAAWHLIKNQRLLFSKRKLSYPIIGGYADICIVPAVRVDDFIFYCGVFAALNLFAEIGLPTAFAFAVDKATSEKEIGNHGLTFWNPTTVGAFQEKYQCKLNTLYKEWPSNTMYVHPIKFSRWK